MHRLPLLALIAVCLGVAAADCGSEPTPTPTLTTLRADIFQPRCGNAACHGGSNPARGLDLVTDTHGAIVGVASVEDPGVVLVEPGSPDSSLLFQVVNGSVGGVRQMPPGFVLPADDVAAIRAWIEAGAPND